MVLRQAQRLEAWPTPSGCYSTRWTKRLHGGGAASGPDARSARTPHCAGKAPAAADLRVERRGLRFSASRAPGFGALFLVFGLERASNSPRVMAFLTQAFQRP
jgi:hypothetical protein